MGAEELICAQLLEQCLAEKAVSKHELKIQRGKRTLP
jgi:hypothetical protein